MAVKLTSSIVHLLLLFVLTVLCFGMTLQGYFLADDFAQIAYAAKILSGSSHLLLDTLTGNYMQLPSINVYRPLFLLSLVADYSIWETNAWGYFLTNLCFYAGDVILLYLIVRELTKQWSPRRSSAAAFLSAAFFAVNPLHCESVAWVVGRVDIICAFFSMLTLYCVLLSRRTHKFINWMIALTSFVLALLTKEMALTLPLVIAALVLLDVQSGKKLWKRALLRSLPFWLILAAYLLYRVSALGTLSGGYEAALGEHIRNTILDRWTDPDTVRRFFVPLPYSLFQSGHFIARMLALGYAALLFLLYFRCWLRQCPFRLWAFLSVWIVASILPVAQLWGLGANLEGSRFYFFLTAPFAVFLATLVCAPYSGEHRGRWHPEVASRATICGCVILIAMIALFTVGCRAVNYLWSTASEQTRSLQKETKELVSKSEPASRLAMLGIPLEYGGAHMFYNADMFLAMLNPPFTDRRYSERLALFMPFLVSPADRFNGQQFERIMHLPGTKGPYVWDGSNRRFELVRLDMPESTATTQLSLASAKKHADTVISRKSDTLELTKLDNDPGLEFGELSINPMQAAFLEYEIDGVRSENDQPQIMVSFAGEKVIAPPEPRLADPPNPGNAIFVLTEDHSSHSQADLQPKSGVQKGRVRLSNHWRWYGSGTINRLKVIFTGVTGVTVRKLGLLSAKEVLPLVDLPSLLPLPSCAYPVFPKGFDLAVDAGSIPAAESVDIQITRPNYLFQSFSHLSSTVESTLTLHKPKDSAHLEPYMFSKPAFYQSRAAALDTAKTVTGETSDPITFYFVGK